MEEDSASNYNDAYWKMELCAARERSYGSSLQRVAETFFYCRLPITRFVDIGSGPGYLLDALAAALPDAANMFFGVELFPPESAFRSKHPNYKLCPLAEIGQKFEAGVCIEVIEHLTPSMLDTLAKQIAQTSAPGAIYLINSGQPEYVLTEDPGYLDPHGRGHVMSYSIEAVRLIFEPHGFTIIPLPGRHWAFLVEYQSEFITKEPIEQLEARIWSPVPENVATLRDGGGGPLMYCAGLDTARCYLEHATVIQRTAWARSLQAEIDRLELERVNGVSTNELPLEMDRSIDHAGLLGRARRWVQRHTS
ncbi:methyltransferase domain-containing protein [Paraburkholderia sp.]|nr:methyltransferase domain-containing protein [Paraburkholderia sp.]